MTPLITDIIILVVLFLSAIIAFMRGFIKEVLTIFSLIGATAAAYIWGPNASPFFTDWGVSLAGGKNERVWGMIPPEIFGMILGYGSIFLSLFIILTILSHFIGKTAQDMGLGSVDRTLGFAFGLGRGILILALINIPLMAMMSKAEQPEWLREAKSMILINNTSQWIVSLNPDVSSEDADENTKESLEALKQETQATINKATIDKAKEKGEGYTDQARDELKDLINQVDE